MANKIDSNLTSFSVAEESTLGVLPGSPIWLGVNVNSYSDLGAAVEKVARTPIDGSRQRSKGGVSHISSSGGFSADLTKDTLSRLIQGFMFANAVDPFSTWPRTGTKLAITAVAAGTGVYSAAAGFAFTVNNLVLCSGFTNAANNGVFKVTVATATTLTTNNAASVVETPPVTAKIEVVGHEFAAGDIAQTVSGGKFTITSTAAGAVLAALNIGQWVYIGGDAAGQQFATGGSGYARIYDKPTASSIRFDKSTHTPVADTGTGKTMRIYFPRFVKNATNAASSVTRSYQLERQLGNDGSGIQSEYIIGAVANEITFNYKMKENITTDLSFVGIDSETRNGATGVKAGTRFADQNEAPYNASNDVWRTTIAPLNTGTLNPAAYLGFVTDYKITVNNNASGLDAIGEVTSFDVNIGSFDVSGDIEAYFTTIAAIEAIKANSNVTMDSIICSLSTDGTYSGKVIDIPLIELSGGLNNVTKDQPIKIPVSHKGLKNEFGYTVSINEFQVLPAIAAPT